MTDEVETIADALTQAMAEAEPAPEAEEASGISEEATEEVEDTTVQEIEVEAATTTTERSRKRYSRHRSIGLLMSVVSLIRFPPRHRKSFWARDKSFQTGYQEKAQTIAGITEALKPWEQSLAQRGITPEQAIRTLFAAQHQLDTDAVGGILQIAQNYGVVDQLREKFAPETDDDELIDPQYKALQQRFDRTGKPDATDTAGVPAAAKHWRSTAD